MRPLLCAAAALLAAALSSFGQYYPVPGSYPLPQTGPQPGSAKDKAQNQLLATFNGTLKGIDKKSLLLEEDSGNELPLHITRKTNFHDGGKKVKATDLKPGTPLSVDAKRFDDGSLDAVNVRVEHPKKRAREDQ